MSPDRIPEHGEKEKKIRVAINGFGRIGRGAFKVALETHGDSVEIVAINDLMEPATLAYLLKYDSVYGVYHREVSHDEKNLIVDGKKYPIVAEKEPASLPWSQFSVDVVIESTGRFTTTELSQGHIKAGAKEVVISAPSEDAPTYILGLNSFEDKVEIINNASCTSNCVGPVTAILHKNFKFLKGWMETVHAYTAETNLVDGPPPALHKDLRRARAAGLNIVPTTTGAAKAVAKAFPEIEGKFDGGALRVPVPSGSIGVFVVLVGRKTTPEEVNETFKKAAAESRYKGILAVTDEPIVSSDILGRPESAIVDLSLTRVVDGDLVVVKAWYDNEFGYSNRLVEQVIKVGKTID